MSLHVAMGYTLGLCGPWCPCSMLAPKTWRTNQLWRQGILFSLLPTTREEWRKAKCERNARLLCGQILDYHWPPETMIKFEKTGGTMTQALLILHTLQWQQPS